MSVYAVSIALFLAAASIIGMVVFLTQFRARRAVAMVALVATMFTVLALCALTLMGARLVSVPMR
jgi:hypothetical protein